MLTFSFLNIYKNQIQNIDKCAVSIRKSISNTWARRMTNFKMVIEDKELLQISSSLLTSFPIWTMKNPTENEKVVSSKHAWKFLNIFEHSCLFNTVCRKLQKVTMARASQTLKLILTVSQTSVSATVFNIFPRWVRSKFGFPGNSAVNSQYIMDNL